MKNLFLLLLVLLTGGVPATLLACNKKKVAAIKFTRTPCYGSCPWYIVDLSQNGDATYTGKKFVKNEGVYNGNISSTHQKQIDDIFDFVNTLKLDTLQDKYDSGATDLSAMRFAFYNSKGKLLKEIVMTTSEPVDLLDLSMRIDSLLTEDQIPEALPTFAPIQE